MKITAAPRNNERLFLFYCPRGPRIDVPDVASLIWPTRHTLSDILFAF
jgi:hypothetical protein